MVNLHLRPLSYYLKLLAATIIVTVFSIIFISAFLLATAVTIPLKFPMCCETPARFGANYESMQFSTADGLTLTGWYVPPRNGAVIILVHSYYADRRQTLPVAEMLSKHGYGLLMYDQRASGESSGNTRSLGWLDIPDLKEAVDWLAAHPEAREIGAYGCSMGGAISLAGAVGVPAIHAIAIDAPSPLEWHEYLPPFNLQDPFSRPIMALYYRMVIFRTRAELPTHTVEAIQNYGPRPLLLISTGQGDEFSRISAYFDAAAAPKTHWNIPNSSHCAAPSTHPQEYEQRLVEFFDAALLNQP
jgi:alpha-beta hydrolase superfamily lysophospholipase